MKSAFSLLEIIFVIVIFGIVASFAVPKFMDTKDSAQVTTIKRDVNTAINSIQSYYLLNQKIEKISDTMTISSDNWLIEDLKISDKNSCLSLEVKTATSGLKTIELVVDTKKETNICKKIIDSGVVSKTYQL
jgi:general secretion pathway protein G